MFPTQHTEEGGTQNIITTGEPIHTKIQTKNLTDRESGARLILRNRAKSHGYFLGSLGSPGPRVGGTDVVRVSRAKRCAINSHCAQLRSYRIQFGSCGDSAYAARSVSPWWPPEAAAAILNPPRIRNNCDRVDRLRAAQRFSRRISSIEPVAVFSMVVQVTSETRPVLVGVANGCDKRTYDSSCFAQRLQVTSAQDRSLISVNSFRQ